MVVDWGAMSDREDRATDRDRATRNAAVNKKTRTKERKQRKERVERYAETVKKKRDKGSGLKFLPVVKALTVEEVIPAIVEIPRSETIYNLIPTPVEYPTAKLVGSVDVGPAREIPWTTNPVAVGLPFIGTILGTLVMMIGNQVVAALASKIGNVDMSGVQYTVSSPGVRIRLHTGKGAGRGRYVRPRGEGGELSDDDADPYDQPSEWYEFWKWAF